MVLYNKTIYVNFCFTTLYILKLRNVINKLINCFLKHYKLNKKQLVYFDYYFVNKISYFI